MHLLEILSSFEAVAEPIFKMVQPALFTTRYIEKFFTPPETIIYPGHDYRGHRESTVAEEKQHNPRLNKRIIKSQFEEIMSALDYLALSTSISQSLQI